MTAFQLEMPVAVSGGAKFSQDGSIRWELRRTWDRNLPIALIVGNNPSNAGATRNDPTVLRWNHFIRAWGFGGYIAMNKYPWVTSDPDECWQIARDYVGQDGAVLRKNLARILGIVQSPTIGKVFVCWGKARGDDDEAYTEVLAEEIQCAGTGELWCWGKNLDGSPKHPMARGRQRVQDDQLPVLWRSAP